MSIADDTYGHEARAKGLVAPYTLVRPEGEPRPCLVTSPHSGNHYPDQFLEALRVPVMDLRRTEDAFVDRLFAAAPQYGATFIAATHARAYIDLNRDARELDASMFSDGLPGPAVAPSPRVQAGLGCIPRIGARGEPIYAKMLSSSDGADRLAGIHLPYHTAIAHEIAAMQQEFGCAILIDCHSMPSIQPGRPELPDIVLGDRFGSSCTNKLTSLVERTFRRLGLTVTRNAPYAGGYTTRCYGRPKRHAHALQIEINRGLYMDEVMVEPLPAMAELIATLDVVISEVSQLAERLRP